ncbi:hypothetical protein ACQPZF_25035 [Actinosynnema sp. CS-041913]|uniref:hypothetical protein n=1 Tax=Actinosynnema sp. CS-041913 TaxID=3239917 RepID=UPI003D925E10
MELMVAVSAEFGVRSEQLAHAWNVGEDGPRVAVARPVTPADHYNASELLGQAVIVLGSLAGGVTANAIYDLLRRLLKRNARGRELYFQKTEKPDGTSIIEVRLSDDGPTDRP